MITVKKFTKMQHNVTQCDYTLLKRWPGGHELIKMWEWWRM